MNGTMSERFRAPAGRFRGRQRLAWSPLLRQHNVSAMSRRPARAEIVYRTDDDAVVIVEVFAKKTQATPKATIATCRKRLKEYDDA